MNKIIQINPFYIHNCVKLLNCICIECKNIPLKKESYDQSIHTCGKQRLLDFNALLLTKKTCDLCGNKLNKFKTKIVKSSFNIIANNDVMFTDDMIYEIMTKIPKNVYVEIGFTHTFDPNVMFFIFDDFNIITRPNQRGDYEKHNKI